eukprot:SAG11_NODE_14538_length_608_cov_1.886051_2_plen_112_part_00
MPMLNLHCHVSPCALASMVFCKLGMDEKANAYAEECLLGDQSQGGDTIASTRIFGLMVQAQLHAREPISSTQKDSQSFVDATFREAATIVVVIWGVLTHPPQIIQKIMLKK